VSSRANFDDSANVFMFSSLNLSYLFTTMPDKQESAQKNVSVKKKCTQTRNVSVKVA
jgi:hypothetical protein